MRYSWRKISLLEAFQLGIKVGLADKKRQKAVASWDGPKPDACNFDTLAAVALADGSIIAGHSEWTGPYSEVTPDTDAQEPSFWHGVPRSE